MPHCYSDVPLTFTLGEDNSILHGLQEGLIGMCPDERRRLRIPPELAKGDIQEGMKFMSKINRCVSFLKAVLVEEEEELHLSTLVMKLKVLRFIK